MIHPPPPHLRREITRRRSALLLVVVVVVMVVVDAVAVRGESASAFVQNAIYSNRITIFSKSYCP